MFRQPGTQTILLVDDDPAVRKLAARILGNGGYMVIEACDGDEALRTAEPQVGCIDLLVTDLIMPGMGGRQLAAEFKRRHHQSRVLYLSAYTADAAAREQIVHEAVEFVQKPFDPNELLKSVRKILDRPLIRSSAQ